MKCVLIALVCMNLVWCGPITVVPRTNQSVSINLLGDITFSCNVSEDESNSAGRQAIWEVQNRQIQSSPVRMAFEEIGIFIEQSPTQLEVVTLVINHTARIEYQDVGVMIRCTAFTISPPETQLGEVLFVRIYGRPEPPSNLRLVASRPAILAWNRPSNIPEDVVVNYTVTINSSNSNEMDSVMLSDQTQYSIGELERKLSNAESCELFMFQVVASAALVEDSIPAVVMDTVPLSTNISAINETLRVDSLGIMIDGTVTSTVSFMAVETCNRNFPIRNYTVLVNGFSGPTVSDPPGTMVTATVNSGDVPALVSGRRFQVGVMACSEVSCRTSSTVALNTSDVQTGRAVFFENNVFLTCTFADGSVAMGCVFMFQVNQNGTGAEEFRVLRSMGSQQCNATGNQENGYIDISVFAQTSNGVDQFAIEVDRVPIASETEFTELTGCALPQDTIQRVPDSRAAAIAVPIVVVLLLVSVVVVIIAAVILYRRLYRKPKLNLQSDSPDTLYLDIASDNHKLLNHPPLTRRSTVPVMQSLPLSTQPMKLNTQTSLPLSSAQSATAFSVPVSRAAPIEVELHRNSIKLKVNTTALRAVARFHSMAKHQSKSAESSLTSEEEQQSLLTMSNISRVHITDEFKSLCHNLPPVDEGEEEELKSWGIINTPPLSPQ